MFFTSWWVAESHKEVYDTTNVIGVLSRNKPILDSYSLKSNMMTNCVIGCGRVYGIVLLLHEIIRVFLPTDDLSEINSIASLNATKKNRIIIDDVDVDDDDIGDSEESSDSDDVDLNDDDDHDEDQNDCITMKSNTSNRKRLHKSMILKSNKKLKTLSSKNTTSPLFPILTYQTFPLIFQTSLSMFPILFLLSKPSKCSSNNQIRQNRLKSKSKKVMKDYDIVLDISPIQPYRVFIETTMAFIWLIRRIEEVRNIE